MKDTKKIKKRDSEEAISSEKPKAKNVELVKKKKMIQKSKTKTEEITISPPVVDVNMKKKKRKVKVGHVDRIIKQSQPPSHEDNSNEKAKGKKGNKTNTKKNKRKAEEISTTLVGEEEDDQPKKQGEGDEAVTRNRKSKKSNKKKKMDLTSTKEKEEDEDVYEISSGDEDYSKGMKCWVTDYYESRPGFDVLQKRIDDYITAHEEHLEQEKQNREAKAAEGGWTVVVHHKGRKKTTETESGTAVGSVSQAALEDQLAKKKQRQIVAPGFYRFQRREAQRNELMELQSKFEQDKKRIQQLRAARKFKPY